MIEEIIIKGNESGKYPFSIPLFANGFSMLLKTPVTILVGENGTGKSTFMKAVQSKFGLYAINDDVYGEKRKDASFVDYRPKTTKPKGFFFESLTFINYIESLNKEKELARAELERVQKEYANASEYARTMASTPFARTLHEINGMYEKDLSQSSHGESYLDFFSSRLRDGQFYLLDEPETPLSTQNQLTLVALILEGVRNGCQFLIATHSPIVAAVPDATIYEILDQELVEVAYDDISGIRMMKQFLNHKEQFLRHL